MSKGTGGGAAIGRLMLITVVGVLAVAGSWWFWKTWEYGAQRLEVRDRVLATSDWNPTRMARADASADCDSGKLRQEAERLLEDVGRFDRSKVERFQTAPTDQRARELANTLKEMEPAIAAFLQAYTCQENSRLVRTGREQQLSGGLIVQGIMVAAWLDDGRANDLRQALWIGRDVQATSGLYEFHEGTLIMDGAYLALARMLQEGALDSDLPAFFDQLQQLTADPESAQLQWRAGARLLLAEVLGDDWEASPPTPFRAKEMLDAMDGVIASLEEMPDVATQPFPDRHAVMTKWVSEHDMSAWNQKFRGFGEAGVEIDERATIMQARGEALLIGTALRMHRKKRGSCPRDLEELVTSEILKALPMDPLTNTPFTYDRATCGVTSGKSPVAGEIVRVVATI